MHYCTTYISPLGPIQIYTYRDALVGLSIEPTIDPKYEKKETPLLLKIKQQLEEYFHQQRSQFDVPLSFLGTSFQNKVWQALLTIPYGTTSSYKEIAIAIGHPFAYRAVGSACNKNPIGIIVPCHRVIGSNHALVGYAGGLHLKSALLALEKNR